MNPFSERGSLKSLQTLIPLTLRPLSLYSIDLAVILTPAQLSCGLGLTAHVHRVKFLSPLEIHPPEDQSF